MSQDKPWVYEAPHGQIRGFGPVVFDKVIGKGTFATIWAAYHIKKGAYVAAKIQYKAVLLEKDAARFLSNGDVELITCWEKMTDEIHVWRKLDQCSSISKLLDVIPTHSGLIILSEYVQYPSFVFDEDKNIYKIHPGTITGLQDSSKVYHLSKTGFWKFAEALIKALHELHSTSIIHKDIKPEHIFLTAKYGRDDVKGCKHCSNGQVCNDILNEFPLTVDPTTFATNQRDSERETLWDNAHKIDHIYWDDNQAVNQSTESDENKENNHLQFRIKLIDFNSAQFADCDGNIWDAEGTQLFTPPEALFRQDINVRTFNGYKRDLWSVGICLFSSLCGSLPFWSRIPIQLQFAIISQPIDFDKLLIHSELPSDSEEVIFVKRLLEKDPVSRWTLEEALGYITQIKSE